MKVLIVGGGIAGITLAHQLQKKHYVTIIDRGAAWRTVGYGVGIWKHGLAILEKLSLDQEFWNAGFPVRDIGILSSKKGAMRFQVTLDTSGKNEREAMSFEREDIHRAIHQKLESVTVKFKTTITSITPVGGGAEVVLSDGSKDTFDLVVGADGLRSTVRSLVFGGDKLKPYGWNIWGAWVPPSTQPFHGYYILGGPRETVFSVPCHGRTAIVLFYRTEDRPIIPKSKEEMLDKFPLLKDQIMDMVSAIADPSSVLHDTLQYVEMDAWYKGRVVLIGDSRHGMSPISGMGTTLALEDGFVLAEELDKNEDVDAALRAFSRRRDRRLKSLVLFRNTFETVGMIDSPAVEGARNLGLKLMPQISARFVNHLFRKVFTTKL